MLRLLFVCVALLIGAPAFAAPPSTPFDWTGFYVGANFGGSWGRTSTEFSLSAVPISSTSERMDGWLGGLQAGYNLQRGMFVFGMESDIQATSQKSTATATSSTPGTPAIPAIPEIPCVLFDPPAPACTPGTGIPGVPGVAAIPGVTGVLAYQQKLLWLATFRARLGASVTPSWLIYATGGLAAGQISTNASFVVPSAVVAASFSDIKAGWAIGVGTEVKLSSAWSAKLEYLYIDLGNTSHTFSSVAPFTGSFVVASHVTDHIVRIGVNFKFD